MSRIDRITELAERLIYQNELYETFLNSSPWGILVVDKTFRIVFMNRQLELMCGYSLSELLGEHISRLMPKEDHNIHAGHEARYVKHPVARTGNHGLKPRIVHKNKSLTDVEVSISPAKIEGQTFFFASIRPIETLFDTVEGKVRDT